MEATKKQEKALLEKLWNSNGYFADTFEEDDLRIMQKNIDNDFPLLVGTFRDKENADLEEQLQTALTEVRTLTAQKNNYINQIDDLKVEVKDLQNQAAYTLKTLLENGLETTAMEIYTTMEIVKFKVQNNMELTDKQKQVVVSTLNQHTG